MPPGEAPLTLQAVPLLNSQPPQRSIPRDKEVPLTSDQPVNLVFNQTRHTATNMLSEVTRKHIGTAPVSADPASPGDPPLMIHITCRANAPLTQAFQLCGWRAEALDYTYSNRCGTSVSSVQDDCCARLRHADFAAATISCVWQSVASCSNATDIILSEITRLQARGGGSIRECQASAAHWASAAEVSMAATGMWWDTYYYSCALQGARCSQHLLRHDILEIHRWPDMSCVHIHDPGEWAPRVTRTGTFADPYQEEAEYTACLAFHIAVSASWWACRLGKAKLSVPRAPPVEQVGDRIGWLQLDPRATREWMMLPMALALGLEVTRQPRQVALLNLPTRRRMPPRLGVCLTADEIYIGPGHHSHRQRTTKWASPFFPGQHGSAADCLALYADYLRSRGLIPQIGELYGMRLLSDRSAEVPCVADVLIAECYTAAIAGTPAETFATPPGEDSSVTLLPTRKRFDSGAVLDTGLLAAAGGNIGKLLPSMRAHMARNPPLYPRPSVRWPQESLERAFARMYAHDTFKGFHFLFIEDLVNAAPFTTYYEWREERQLTIDGPLPPLMLAKDYARMTRGSSGVQRRAFSHGAAFPPTVSFGLSPDQHFREAMLVAQGPSPLERPPKVDEDLYFAAYVMCGRRERLDSIRSSAVAAVRQLKHRWRAVTSKLRTQQPPTVWKVTKNRDIGLLPLLVLLLSWPDVTKARHLLTGYPAIGHCSWCGIFPRREVPLHERKDVYENAVSHNKRLLSSIRPGSDRQGRAFAHQAKAVLAKV